MRRLPWCFLIAASSLSAQEPQEPQADSRRPIDLWASGTVAAAGVSGTTTSLAGQASLWTAIGRGIVGIRKSAATDLKEGFNFKDVRALALLFGIRFTDPDTQYRSNPGGRTASIAVGLSRVRTERGLGFDHGIVTERETAPGLAFAGEASVHLRAVGIGLTSFGDVAPGTSYVALGLTLNLGKIH